MITKLFKEIRTEKKNLFAYPASLCDRTSYTGFFFKRNLKQYFSLLPVLGTHLSCTAQVCRGAHGGVQSGRVATVICRDSSTPPSCQVTNAFRMKLLYNKTGFFCSLPNTSRNINCLRNNQKELLL